jgi:hypothetical protein
MYQKSKSIAVVILALALGFGVTAAFAKNGNGKSDQEKNKAKPVNIKNFEKPDKAKGETNAQVHREKTEEVVQNLEQVVTQEEAAGNSEISGQIGQVVKEQEQTQEQTAEAIEQVEKRGKVKTFLVGTDYKNLGQLRSSLVHNRNDIRKLTQALAQVQGGENTVLLQGQIADLMLERERIKSIIQTNESSFSLFGWVSRFLNNYEQTPVNDKDEADLVEEVEDAVNTVPPVENQDTADETAPTSTTVTGTVPTP